MTHLIWISLDLIQLIIWVKWVNTHWVVKLNEY